MLNISMVINTLNFIAVRHFILGNVNYSTVSSAVERIKARSINSQSICDQPHELMAKIDKSPR
jgi:hypothetical protein